MRSFLEALALGSLDRGGWQDGRVVDLRGFAGSVYLVGDLHAHHQRIETILEHAQLPDRLERGEAVLIFLGDLFHPEADDEAGDMDSSLATLKAVARLKTAYPRGLYVLLGNHEFTRSQSTKRGYFQGDLFRRALETEGLDEVYDEFLRRSPLVMLHRRWVGVHAGPAVSVASLDELKTVEVVDVPPLEMPAALRELTFTRHVDWSPNPTKSYGDYEVEDFLKLCQVPEARLVTGHTPLDRETDWTWQIGAHLTVIFAAGRELGYLRLGPDGDQLVRVGRYQGATLVSDRGGGRVAPAAGPLEPDVVYRFDYVQPVHLEGPHPLSIRHYRHLSAASQAYYGQGYYLVGNEFRGEVLGLKSDSALVLGGPGLCGGVRFHWPDQEFAVLWQREPGRFEVRALVEGLQFA